MDQQELEIWDRYDVEASVEYIISRRFQKVTLQFPDDLLGEASAVGGVIEKGIQERLSALEESPESYAPKVFLLADTTFSSCCVDEVAAAHVGSDCLLHFGHACLSPVSRLPVRFIFGRSPLPELDRLCEQVVHLHNAHPAKTTLVLYDLDYAYAMPKLQALLRDALPSDSASHVCVEVGRVAAYEAEPSDEPITCTSTSNSSPDDDSTSQQRSRHHDPHAEDRRAESLGGLVWDLPSGVSLDEEESLQLVWVGREGPPLTALLMRAPLLTCALYRPEDNTWVPEIASVSKALKRRYFLVQKAKEANIVGILVGTLGVAGYRTAIHRLRSLIQRSGKKCYTMAMGRVTPHKLANFPEVDVFVLVACAQTALVQDLSDFLAPVLTPFEAALAFTTPEDKERPWPGHIQLDFQALVPAQNEGDDMVGPENKEPQEGELQEPRFSLISGGYVAPHQPTRDVLETLAPDPNDLAIQAKHALTLAEKGDHQIQQVTSAAEYLVLKRSYQGMQASAVDKTTPEPILEPLQGSIGRAATYTYEKNDQSTTS